MKIRYGNARLERELTRTNDDHETPLFVACKYDSHTIVEELCGAEYESIIDVNKPDKNGLTPLMIAEQKQHNNTILVMQLIGSFDNLYG